MILKRAKPAPGERQLASVDDLADGSIGSENSPAIIETQARYIERRFLLPAPLARTVAALHFAEGPA